MKTSELFFKNRILKQPIEPDEPTDGIYDGAGGVNCDWPEDCGDEEEDECPCGNPQDYEDEYDYAECLEENDYTCNS